MSEQEKILAVDFDGTLCANKYPGIGEARQDIINEVLRMKKKGWIIILWTCRAGERLEEAAEWCKQHGLYFDYINENSPNLIKAYGHDPRKISATAYLDDRAIQFVDNKTLKI